MSTKINKTNFRMTAMLALMLVLSTVLATTVKAQSYWCSVKIQNGSRYDIRSVYISPASVNSWGIDRLGDDVLIPGYVLTTQLRPGVYDLKLVDEDGDVCVVPRISISQDTTWVINSRWLVNCELH